MRQTMKKHLVMLGVCFKDGVDMKSLGTQKKSYWERSLITENMK